MDRSRLVLVLLLGAGGCAASSSVQGTESTAEMAASGATPECLSSAAGSCRSENAQPASPATLSRPAPVIRGNTPPPVAPLVPSQPSVHRVNAVPAAPQQPPRVVDSTLSSLRSSWHAHAPSEYVLASCGSGAAPPSCTLQAVRRGAVVAREQRSFDTEEWAASESSDSEDPIDALFDELETPPDQCRVTYELGADYAYLSRIYYDCGQEGWGINVVCFEADTLDLEACRASVH